MTALQGQNLSGPHAAEYGEMRDDALARFQNADVLFDFLLCHGGPLGYRGLLGRIQRSRGVAIHKAFGKRELEDRPQVLAQMRCDTAGECFRFAYQERLQSLEAQVG